MTSSLASIGLQFCFATLLPIIASVAITMLSERFSFFGRLGCWPQQVIIGLVFGAIAIYGTEAGIATHDATMNVRDAAPLVAGLYFGGPAGIIAGIVGGVERWFAALWGRGMFTRLACSVATIFAGLYAAGLRKYLFNHRRPSWLIAFAIGMVAEVLHMLLIFLTNIHNPVTAFYVAQACTLPMVTFNALSVSLSGAVLSLMSGQGLQRKADVPDISQKIQSGMLVVVSMGFLATLAFVSTVQANLSQTDTTNVLTHALTDVDGDIEDASDANLLELARLAAKQIPAVGDANQATIERLASELNLAEVNVIDSNGRIVASLNPKHLGFDMASGEQAAEFLSLLPGGDNTEVVQNYQPTTFDPAVWRKFAGVSIEGGALQVGYDATRFVGDLMERIRIAVAHRHVGNDGLLVVTTERSELVGTRNDVVLSVQDVLRLSGEMEATPPRGEIFRTTFHDTTYLGMCQESEGLRIIALLPAEEARLDQDLTVMITSFMQVLVFAALFMAIYLLINQVVVRSIWQVNGQLDEITSGNLLAEVDVRNSTEFRLLSDDINNTVAALRSAIAAESARIESDLATAKAIQEAALPSTFPPFPDIDAFDIFASMKAAREVGGDFYDFFLVDGHTLAFLIADVSGKGIPASLFMMASKSELASNIKSGMALAEAVRSANWNICQNNDAEMFVTVWAATLDYETGLLTYVNAGHNPPLLRRDGSWQWLTERSGPALGVFDMARFRSHTLELSHRDELLLYTDGVNEAFSANNEQYGNDRLEEFLNRHTDLHPRMLVDVLRADLRRWEEGAEQSDDITILSLEYGQPPEASNSIRVPSTDEGLQELMHRMRYDLTQQRCPDDVQERLINVMKQLFGTICRSSYADKGGDIELAYVFDTDPAAITVSISDWGEPFDPLSHDDVADKVALDGIEDAAYVRDGDRNMAAFHVSW